MRGDYVQRSSPMRPAQGDVCWFSGDIASVQNIRKIPGLVPHTNQLSKLPDDHDQV